MPTIISSPTAALHACYMPTVWRVLEYTFTNEMPPVMKVEYIQGASNVLHTATVTHIESEQAPPRYYFEIDAQEVASAWFSNVATLPADGVAAMHTDILALKIRLTPLKDLGSGYLVEIPGDAVESTVVRIANAYRMPQEEYNLDDYAIRVQSSAVGIMPWLTRRPDHVEICSSMPHYISYMRWDKEAFVRVTSYDSAGTQIATDFWEYSFKNSYRFMVLDASPNGINRLHLYGGWDGAGVTITDAVHRYEISTFEKGETIDPGRQRKVTLYPSHGCCAYQLVFLNSFGAFECLPLTHEEVLTYSVAGEVFASKRLMPTEAAYLQSRGIGTIYNEGRNAFQFSIPQSADVLQDFYRELLSSSVVFLRWKGQLVPVVLERQTVNLRSNSGIVVTLTWSNAARTHNN